jgi:hypothetical protein
MTFDLSSITKSAFVDTIRLLTDAPNPAPAPVPKVAADFYAYLPSHQYIFVATGDLWPRHSIDSVLGRIEDQPASKYLDQTRSVDQMTWAPGEPQVIQDKLIVEGGWLDKDGARCFNLYRPPTIVEGNANDVNPWLEHIRLVYPDDRDRIIGFLAHRVQYPATKINHALVLGGGQGIGKDTILEPVKDAVGPWNFQEIGPNSLFGRFNGYSKCVILRISEARDLGDVDRYAFYERIKTYTAAPPDSIRIDEKNIREYPIPNVCGVVITTNHLDGLYLAADDRRHYVAWSEKTKESFEPGYFRSLYAWLNADGRKNVTAYLRAYDIRSFDAKTPPPKSDAWQRIVDSGRSPEDAELADVIDALGRPKAVTLKDLSDAAQGEFGDWLVDRKNRRIIPHRLATSGYVPVRNDSAKDGLWVIDNKRKAVYAQVQLAKSEQIMAAYELLGIRIGQGNQLNQ